MFPPESNRLELTPPQVDVISGATANRLEQAEALATAKNWAEAVELLHELSADKSDRVVALADGRYLGLQTYCHVQLSQMPAQALVAYRRRVDPIAGKWYREGIERRDERLLHRVVAELFCSSWGDDALLALGELALERGDYATARRMWQQISPQARDPIGRPLWFALRHVDLDKHWPRVEQRWPVRSQPIDWLAYPDSDIDLADVRARLILTSIRADELERAALELDAFRRWHPTAVGRLGGQESTYVDALERLLVSAAQWPAMEPQRDWPTFAGSPARSATAAPIGKLSRSWENPIHLAPIKTSKARVGGVPFDEWTEAQTRESHRPLGCFPVVVDGLLLYADATAVHAVELATGKPAITNDGILGKSDAGQTENDFRPPQQVAAGVPRHTLSVADGIVFARVGRIETVQLNPAPLPVNERIIGLDLRRDGILTFEARPDDEKWWFDGAPIGDGRRVYTAMRRGDVTPHAYVACFDVASGRRLWRTPIGGADTPATGRGDEITHNLLSLVGDRIYFNTNLGLVAALDVETGRIAWLHRYERRAQIRGTQGLAGPLHLDRDPSPCFVQQDIVIVAPSDTSAVFALDADTGRQLWSTDELADALHLLGSVGENLIVTGNRFWMIDTYSGRIKHVWPESEFAGIRGMGRGVLAGNEVFWPTRKEIYVFDAHSGRRSRPPIDLAPIGGAGANVIAAEGYMIVAGRELLLACGPPVAQPKRATETDAKVADAD